MPFSYGSRGSQERSIGGSSFSSSGRPCHDVPDVPITDDSLNLSRTEHNPGFDRVFASVVRDMLNNWPTGAMTHHEDPQEILPSTNEHLGHNASDDMLNSGSIARWSEGVCLTTQNNNTPSGHEPYPLSILDLEGSQRFGNSLPEDQLFNNPPNPDEREIYRPFDNEPQGFPQPGDWPPLYEQTGLIGPIYAPAYNQGHLDSPIIWSESATPQYVYSVRRDKLVLVHSGP
jgi:hypothetical protein